MAQQPSCLPFVRIPWPEMVANRSRPHSPQNSGKIRSGLGSARTERGRTLRENRGAANNRREIDNHPTKMNPMQNQNEIEAWMRQLLARTLKIPELKIS